MQKLEFVGEKNANVRAENVAKCMHVEFFICFGVYPPKHHKSAPMANATFPLDALVASPPESLAWLEQCFQDSCDAVASDIASAIAAVNLARDLAIKQCRTSARAHAKSVTATHEGLRNVAVALDAIASLCASTSVDDAEAAVKAG